MFKLRNKIVGREESSTELSITESEAREILLDLKQIKEKSIATKELIDYLNKFLEKCR